MSQTTVENDAIEVLLEEQRVFPPPAAFVEASEWSDPEVYAKASSDPEGWWESWAKKLDWIEPWSKVLDWSDAPFAKWFVGGKLNVSANCLDRHVAAGKGDRVAYYWEGEDGERRAYTYAEMLTMVKKFANVLKGLGVKKGDRVAIFLPMVIELPVAMLACTRIGAPHSVVFGGFSSQALADRINDSDCQVVITADGGYRRGNVVPLKELADEAMKSTPGVRNCVVVQRMKNDISWQDSRDLWWHDLMADTTEECAPEPMDSEDLLYLLYTSGTTAKPKGIMHTTGGYLTGVSATAKMVFDLRESDVYWCAADIGWVTGHSYIVYGPLANGATSVLYEGAPDWPEKDRNWEIIERYGVTILYTAPTAIRAFIKWGDQYPNKHDLSSLRLLGSVGEPINPEAWIWYHKVIGGERCPIVDTWWQTETGQIMVSPLPAITATKPGSGTHPLPGIDAVVVDEQGVPVEKGHGGYLVLRKPWPAMTRGIWGDKQRFVDTYWSKYAPHYFAGDGAKFDEDGYIWVLGRVDDVMNVSGHRISTMEVESSLVEHPKVAEAAVVGKAHEVSGECICAFVTVDDGVEAGEDLIAELRDHVSERIGKFARPNMVLFADQLPKTRSGKIMRRLLKDIAEGRELGDTTTLQDASVVEDLRNQVLSRS